MSASVAIPQAAVPRVVLRLGIFVAMINGCNGKQHTFGRVKMPVSRKVGEGEPCVERFEYQPRCIACGVRDPRDPAAHA